MADGKREFTRRTLLAAGVAGAASGLSILPVHAETVTRKRQAAPNDRITIGLIGCGGMGNVDVRWALDEPEIQVGALCDVDQDHLDSTSAGVMQYSADHGKTGAGLQKPAAYKDYRQLLDRKDIDAVIITTPDHWHALPLIGACEAGKDAYCEKPISHDIREALSMAGAVRHYGRVVQVGTWQRSTPEFVSAVAFVRAGKIGRITSCRAWTHDTQVMGNQQPSGPPPATFDYDLWTGPAPMRPYIADYTHNNWRWFFTNGEGMTGDWGVHMMDICLLGMSKDTDLPMPSDVSAYGGKLAHPDDARTTPDTVTAVMRFHDPEFVMTWTTERDHANLPDHGSQFVGDDGKAVTVWRGGWTVRDADGKDLPKEEAPPTDKHMRNWIDCMKSRSEPRSNLRSMAQTTLVCHMVNASYLSGDTVRWSKDRMSLMGRGGRDTLAYNYSYRRPWTFPVYEW